MKDKNPTKEEHESAAITREVTVGNFVFGDWAGDVRCSCGHEVRHFNIGRGHWVACDKCRTYTFIGSNLMSSWRSEDETIWGKNDASVRAYRVIE